MADRNAVKVLDRPEASVLGEMVASELGKQIATAKQYPRDENAALDQVLALATRSDATAELCMYSLKRNDKGKTVFITGPSIRFAELLVYCWGNIRAGARIVEEADKYIIAQGVAYDLQRNTGLMTTIRRGIATSSGGRYSADMINVTSNAACSIAERNAIIDCIPQILWQDVYEKVKAKAIGAAQIPERIQKAVKFFISKGAKEEDILTAMDVKAIADMGREHLEIFIGLQTAMKEGSVTAEKIFTADGAEQRARLNLMGDDDPADPNVRGTPIDNLVAPPADQKKGGAPAKEAAQVEGDGSSGESDTAKAKPADAPADPAGTDEAQLAEIEAEVKATRSKRAVILNNRTFLETLSGATPPSPLKARADALLNKFDLDT